MPPYDRRQIKMNELYLALAFGIAMSITYFIIKKLYKPSVFIFFIVGIVYWAYLARIERNLPDNLSPIAWAVYLLTGIYELRMVREWLLSWQ